MPYIYKITNIVNDKVYIGKTLKTIEERWREHCQDYTRSKNEKRPLYNAMNAYGKENFSIEMIEECNAELLNEREKYWIEYYGSFKNGYNATKGGDGTQYADYDLICRLYKEFPTIRQVSAITGYDYSTIEIALSCNGVSKEEIKSNGLKAIMKPVAKCDLKTGEVLEVYPSAIEAERQNGNTKHINDVCKGKRKSCKGFSWKYI